MISSVCLQKKTGWDNTMKGLRHLNVPTCHEILLGVLFILFFVDQTKTQLIGKYFKYLYLISRAINLIPISWYLCLVWENETTLNLFRLRWAAFFFILKSNRNADDKIWINHYGIVIIRVTVSGTKDRQRLIRFSGTKNIYSTANFYRLY